MTRSNLSSRENPFFIPSARKVTDIGEANYPEPSAHGIQPAWGFSISHAEDIRLKNIHLETIHEDERPAFYMEDTKNLHLNKITCPHEHPDIILEDVKNQAIE